MPSDRSRVPGVLPAVPTVTHEESPALEPDENGAPDPLEHAMPDVEFAEAQLAEGRPTEPEPEDEADEAEFELEVEESIARGRGGRRGGDGVSSRGGASPGGGGAAVAGAPAHAEARRGIFARLIAFLQGSWRELQRVQWPDRRQVAQATGVVIGFVIVAAAFLGLADLVSQKVVTFILK
ncbi:MAG: preprotein translocase subunit SecE [Solirubrobacterales bacterium]|nr:preprotein translocase subunit SecE [Solirubrobacterales bacterium]